MRFRYGNIVTWVCIFRDMEPLPYGGMDSAPRRFYHGRLRAFARPMSN